MSISVIIPTFNNANRWEGRQLVDSLWCQSFKPSELLICDDGSTDDTVEVLKDIAYNHWPFRIRLFQRTKPRTSENTGPGLAENFLFSMAEAQAILHLDDDGLVDRRLVEFAESLDRSACYWGQIEFIDENGKKLSHRDSRREHYPAGDGVYPMRKGNMHAWGSLWCAPTELLRKIGGHDMPEVRAQDSRTGFRLQEFSPGYYVTKPEFVFRHFGLPTQYRLTHGQEMRGKSQEAKFKAAQDMKTYRETHVTPHLGNWKPVLIANGGMDFWKSSALAGLYEEVKV